MAIHSSGQAIFSFAHMEGITLGAGEEVDEVAGGASGMGVDRIGKTGDRDSEGQSTRVYGTCFTAGSLTRVGVRGGMRWLGIKVSYDKEMTEVRKMVEGD